MEQLLSVAVSLLEQEHALLQSEVTCGLTPVLIEAIEDVPELKGLMTKHNWNQGSKRFDGPLELKNLVDELIPFSECDGFAQAVLETRHISSTSS